MGDRSVPVHQYISGTPPLDVLPSWIIRKNVAHLLGGRFPSGEVHRKIICTDFDPYCFAPQIDGIHGQLAFGKLGLPQLKKSLTLNRNKNQLGKDLNTLCDLLHDPEKALEAIDLNIPFQLRRLVDHGYFYVRQRAIEAIKILAGQPTGRQRVVNDNELMNRIIRRIKDPSLCVRRTVYNLICILSTNYLATSKLKDYDIIELIIDELKSFIPTEKVESEEGEIVEAELEECCLEEEEVENEMEAESNEKYKGESMIRSGSIEEEELENAEEHEGPDEDEMVDKDNEALDVVLMRYIILEPVDQSLFGLLNELTYQTQISLLETLVNLMSFSRDTTLDAICDDVLLLKKLLNHENDRVRLLMWNWFKQIFSTDIGRVAFIPHNLLDEMMKRFENETDDEEFVEVLGTLMLALINVDNRVAAWKRGILDKVVRVSKMPMKPTKRLAVINVLSHLAELPDARRYLRSHLFDIVSVSNVDTDPNMERHLAWFIELVLWTP